MVPFVALGKAWAEFAGVAQGGLGVLIHPKAVSFAECSGFAV